MAKKDPRNTRRKIVTTAWKLFYEQGYDSTTVDQIISESGTSKGSFYHYFNGKDALLSSLSSLFDDKYEELMKEIDPEMNSFDKLLLLNRELFQVIESTVSVDLMSRMYATQLTTTGEKHLLDQGRTYYKLLAQNCPGRAAAGRDCGLPLSRRGIPYLRYVRARPDLRLVHPGRRVLSGGLFRPDAPPVPGASADIV